MIGEGKRGDDRETMRRREKREKVKVRDSNMRN